MRMAAIAAAPNAHFPFAQRSLSVFSRTPAPCLGPDRSHRCCRRRPPRGLPYVTSVRIAHPIGGRPSPDAFGKVFHVASPLQDSVGVITPSSLHYAATPRGSFMPAFDPRRHPLII